MSELLFGASLRPTVLLIRSLADPRPESRSRNGDGTPARDTASTQHGGRAVVLLHGRKVLDGTPDAPTANKARLFSTAPLSLGRIT
jgi:hypothetical protein